MDQTSALTLIWINGVGRRAGARRRNSALTPVTRLATEQFFVDSESEKTATFSMLA